MTVHHNPALDASLLKPFADQYAALLEQQLRVVIRPKPRWWPNFFYRWALRRLVVVEMTLPRVTMRGE